MQKPGSDPKTVEKPLYLVNIPAETDLNVLPTASAETNLSESLLRKLLTHIKPVDFRERLQLDEGDSLSQMLIAVAVVEEVLRLSKSLNWGLCRKHDFIYLFNGEFWRENDKEELKTFLGEAAAKMGHRNADARRFDFRDKLFKQFLSDAHLPIPEPNAERVLINLQNGTFEISLKGGNLRPFNRADFLTYQLSFQYAPNAECPLFNGYLSRVLPDQGLQDVTAEFFAYVFTRHLKLEKCLLAYGTGANGKSVLFDIINAVLGRDNISCYSLSNLREEHNRAMITNKLLNYGSEIRAGIEADDLKLLVSGEPIQARLKYGNSFIMSDYAKLAFNCNTLPRDVEHTEAYFRRFLIVPFEVTIPEEERDPNLAKKIVQGELPGVFNWILKGLDRLLKNEKFSDSKRAKETLVRYRQESDTIWLFVEEKGFKPSFEAKNKLTELYQQYRIFCGDDGYRPVGKKIFSERLKRHGFESDRDNAGIFFYLTS